MEAAKETVNSLLTTASKMVYGDSNGTDTTDTNTTGDKGSLLGDDTSSSTGNNTTGGIEPVSGQSGPGTSDKPYDAGNTTGEPTNTTGSSSTDPSDLTDTTSKSSATATTAQDVGSAPPESGAAPTTKQQGADKPTDAPDSTQSEAISNKKEAAEDAMSDEKNAAGGTSSTGDAGGSSGPADGAAGGDGGGSSGSTSDTAGPEPLSSKSASGPGSGQDDALGSKSDEKGTGEKYIKSSGVKADGGDFDAANAGAGREADRLLEEKGIHREGGNTGPPQEIAGDKGASSAEGEKSSIGQKIKDKLHIKNKDKP